MKTFLRLQKLIAGDQVAIISPSAGLPGLFPWVQDLGLERLRTEFGLVPKEYPTTRMMGASPEDRARDVTAAFADPANKAVFASIGGNDQVRIIKHLDPAVFRNNPKPFFGFSDNTHLHHFLWRLGIPSYYGGAIMNQFAMQGQMDALTVGFLKHALFDEGEYALEPSTTYNELLFDWSEKENLSKRRPHEPNDGFVWDGEGDVNGLLWGGCAESLVLQAASGVNLPSDEELEGTILFIETAEDIPDPWVLESLLIGYGERGWFDRFQAVLVGRPRAWGFSQPNDAPTRAAYRQTQRRTILKTVRHYHPTMPVVQNLDCGHTDPQTVLPLGGNVRVNSGRKEIIVSY